VFIKEQSNYTSKQSVFLAKSYSQLFRGCAYARRKILLRQTKSEERWRGKKTTKRARRKMRQSHYNDGKEKLSYIVRQKNGQSIITSPKSSQIITIRRHSVPLASRQRLRVMYTRVSRGSVARYASSVFENS